MTTQQSLFDVALPASPKPILRWCGGKARLARYVAQRVLEAWRPGGTYYEPFLGGAAVFLYLRAHSFTAPAVLSDALYPLIDLYAAVADSPREVALYLQDIAQAGATKAYYLHIRQVFNERTFAQGSEFYRQAARLLYLNHRGFNGLYRTNQKGELNTPWGGDRRTPLPSRADLDALAQALEGARLRCSDFEATISKAGPGDVVYADPPYAGTYTGYAGGFSEADQRRLRDALLAAHQRGAAVLASNRDCEEVRELYGPPFSIEGMELAYTIGGKGARRERTKEVLISAGVLPGERKATE